MEKTEDLQLNGLKIIQDDQLFCFGTDAVLLADFASVKKNESVVDLGTGTGILPVLMYGRQPLASYKAVEIQPALCSLAKRSVELNGIAGSVRVELGDIKDAAKMFGRYNDVVVCNPPYEKPGEGAERCGESHLIARKEIAINFSGLCASAFSLLKTGGRFYIVHKVFRLAELLCTLKEKRLEPKLIRFVHNDIYAEPSYVLIKAVKEAAVGLRTAPPLLMRDERGNESEELKKIYNRK